MSEQIFFFRFDAACLLAAVRLTNALVALRALSLSFYFSRVERNRRVHIAVVSVCACVCVCADMLWLSGHGFLRKTPLLAHSLHTIIAFRFIAKPCGDSHRIF